MSNRQRYCRQWIWVVVACAVALVTSQAAAEMKMYSFAKGNAKVIPGLWGSGVWCIYALSPEPGCEIVSTAWRKQKFNGEWVNAGTGILGEKSTDTQLSIGAPGPAYCPAVEAEVTLSCASSDSDGGAAQPSPPPEQAEEQEKDCSKKKWQCRIDGDKDGMPGEAISTELSCTKPAEGPQGPLGCLWYAANDTTKCIGIGGSQFQCVDQCDDMYGEYVSPCTGTDKEPDKDGDGVPDDKDNCPNVPNQDQKDTDGFGTGDACDKDDDEDKLLDSEDPLPLNPDADIDGLPDGYEVHLFGTSPLVADGDQDGLVDGQEVQHYSDPKKADTDDDGLTDGEEVNIHATSPTKKDSDGDGSEDGQEVALASDPKDPESTPILFFAIVTEFLHDGDYDGDGIDDPFDNCKEQLNGNQADGDGDTIGDVCDSFDNRALDWRRDGAQQGVPQGLKGKSKVVKQPAWMMKKKTPAR